MFSYKFFIRSKRGSLRLKITNNRASSDMCLDIMTTNEELADALSENPSNNNIRLSKTLRAYISKLKQLQMDLLEEGAAKMDARSIRERARSMLVPNIETFMSDSESNKAGTESVKEVDQSKLFDSFFRRCMDAKANDGYRATYDFTLKKLAAYPEYSDSLVFEDITLRWLNAFDEWLTKSGLSKNSRNIIFKNIRTVINRAIDEELTDKYPFRRFKIRPEETRKRSLSVEDLRKLFDYPCEEYQKFYIDMFKLSFLLIGINPVDMYGLKCVEYGRVEYRRAKTHKLYSVKVEPEAMEIINRWKGDARLLCIADRWKDYKDFTKNANIAFKKIGKLTRSGLGGKKHIVAEWPDLSMYFARHSWATVAYSLNIPYDIIAQALGHKNSGPSVTATYIKTDEKKVDEANRRVIDFVLYGKMPDGSVLEKDIDA